ncbi:hypothetical protein SNOG_16310 [Parastagonospora nodorum SN15]|uniref:IBR domain-containing protein n=1 Tax=Phaeosphaeria nodorum (strain SN15 / ATCC MYA-4574 / FGSC 10173) TaxID=321614 RepID=Q0TVY9_PHANO|nr:hypothetical protein SNOG_16310 [Parastagonospora nodorum SN15]EAT76296.2 hypothetical protein SNOG_16310 [Parastagonospora nodorum SN15]
MYQGQWTLHNLASSIVVFADVTQVVAFSSPSSRDHSMPLTAKCLDQGFLMTVRTKTACTALALLIPQHKRQPASLRKPKGSVRHGDESDDQSVIITGSGPAPARQQNPFMTPALTFAGHRNGHLARRIKRQEKRHSDELRRMSAVLSQCQGELAAARQESRLYQDELVTARQELGIYQDALVTARQESGDYQDELAAARQESGDYQDELAVARQDLGLYQDALAAARQESSDYQDALAAARQESGDSQDELAAARQESSDYQDELAAARQELGDYHDELAAADEEFSIMQTNIRETQFHHSVQRCQDCAGKIEDSDIYVYDHCGAFRCGKCVRQHGEIACLQHEELGPQGMHRVYGGLECTLGTCEESEDPRRLHDLPCGKSSKVSLPGSPANFL